MAAQPTLTLDQWRVFQREQVGPAAFAKKKEQETYFRDDVRSKK
jgi:hypothetical protein